MYALILARNGSGYILDDFFTSSSGHRETYLRTSRDEHAITVTNDFPKAAHVRCSYANAAIPTLIARVIYTYWFARMYMLRTGWPDWANFRLLGGLGSF
jgi:hypothetical protein